MLTSEDTVRILPSIVGSVGPAWRLDPVFWLTIKYSTFELEKCHPGGDPNAPHAQVAYWLIEAPWAHPVWHSYVLSLVHLRPLAGVPDPIIYLEGATHEVSLAALNPEKPRQTMIDTGYLHILQPLNFAAQIIAGTDERAISRVEAAVWAVCNGKLSPDTDFMLQWVSLFGGNMTKNYPTLHNDTVPI